MKNSQSQVKVSRDLERNEKQFRETQLKKKVSFFADDILSAHDAMEKNDY